MEANPLNSNPEKVVRKLTTILASDVVGYSKMMSADEEARSEHCVPIAQLSTV